MNEKPDNLQENLSQGSFDFVEGNDYAAALESVSHLDIKPSYGNFINGKFVDSSSGKFLKSINPSNKKPICEISLSGSKDVDKAVKAARNCFNSGWGTLSGKDRSKYMFRIARLLQERAKDFALAESLDGGKPIKESKSVDIPLAAAHFFYYAGWADKLDYAFPGHIPEPLGVVGQIIPWNFPLLMAAWKIAPALACGNTVVLKPAETTSLTALMLAELLIDADLPPGAVNIITGDGSTGQLLVDHGDINKIAFTGSTAVGKKIMSSIAGTDKRYTLELGGKSANIIFEDAAIDQAVEGIINAIYFNQGHVCCAGSRLLVQEGIFNEVVGKLKDRLKTLRVGDPLDKNTDIGAINSADQYKKIQSYIKIGEDEGCSLYQSDVQLPKDGYFIAPSFFTDVSQSHRIANEEIFGPVLSIQTFRTAEEAISMANNSAYGLAAGIWTDKGSKIFKVTSQINAGIIWANTYNKFDPTSPFGGYKESGVGREGGIHGLEAYLSI